MGFSIAVRFGLHNSQQGCWQWKGNNEGGGWGEEQRGRGSKGMMKKWKKRWWEKAKWQRQREELFNLIKAKHCERAWERNKTGLRQRSHDEWCHGLRNMQSGIFYSLQVQDVKSVLRAFCFVCSEIYFIRLIKLPNLNLHLLRPWRAGGLIWVVQSTKSEWGRPYQSLHRLRPNKSLIESFHLLS